ncbi:XrtN system VIT domain-containing protein [Flavobacterium sp. MC2016-06]|uniref:XrtN system VIT domain-containing protein n=1 Tax=Flavobacterium sp. MC2016-06 TaxID=2676308 RepID=UPI0012BA6ACB|nr:XrtN system VIT domain-containing protein [Flavobacterium sp. MC2016-06]MBU3859947.1 XrtN system VIT domain-containing protein [Flavobacterium sp. MC2016-06]
MKTTEINTFLNDKIGAKISLFVTLFSTAMLILLLIGSKFDYERFEMLSAVNIIIQLPYGAILTFNVLRNREKYQHLIPFLFLNWFIGCFSANILINIFENLPIWVYCTTFLFCFSNFVIYNNAKNNSLNILSYFINGCSILLIVYYAIFLIPISFFSVIGILALGLGFYGLVPAIVLVVHTAILSKTLFEQKNTVYAFFSGIGLVLAGLTFFTILLNAESQKINKYGITKTFEQDGDLPAYIKVSQNLRPNFLNEILLKKDIVYIATDDFFSLKGFGSFGNNTQYNERKSHNPFLNIAYHFAEEINLSDDDKINILKSNFDKRLETEEQLWSGKDLITKNIKEDVKIYPNDRLAYTEITMDVACNEKSWGQKEAIYSFQLPEGSVATSLSLWVNGIERKGVLTTKEKAKAAYNQIVGVEYRDPSLMQWKEGNRVTVRIFPITNESPRTFKCGFTTPLKVVGSKMAYQSLDIKGPNINTAATISRIQVSGNTEFEATKDFDFVNNYHINNSKGLDKWEASFPLSKKPLSSAFTWKNKSYEVKPIIKERIAFVPSEIILDLNNSWKIEELEAILNLPNKKYFVFINNEKQEINSKNHESIWRQFEELNYSLLPLFDLKKNSLIVTKCGTFSTNFEELESSNYLKKIKTGAKNKTLKVINISDEVNPFWQTVKEQKYVTYIQTNINTCTDLISKNNFIKFKTDDSNVNLETAGISIQENPIIQKTTNKGSNHLYRMFCFGKVLNDQVEIQADSLKQNKYVDLAKDANIVTPISSLIVLETDEDYKKNGIEKNVDTLGNASINNDGSVPEPHEWAMLIIGLSLILFYYRKQKLTN